MIIYISRKKGEGIVSPDDFYQRLKIKLFIPIITLAGLFLIVNTPVFGEMYLLPEDAENESVHAGQTLNHPSELFDEVSDTVSESTDEPIADETETVDPGECNLSAYELFDKLEQDEPAPQNEKAQSVRSTAELTTVSTVSLTSTALDPNRLFDEEENDPVDIYLSDDEPTTNNFDWFFRKEEDIDFGEQHTNHFEFYASFVNGYNKYVLKAIDKVQSSAMDGGGYFIGKYADPAESPIGYDLTLFHYPLIDAPRTTSFCTGVTYAAFIETLNDLYENKPVFLSYQRWDSFRMQETNGDRREDYDRFWGYWNAPAGNVLALTRYSDVGIEISPRDARPGDFVFIQNKSGSGHIVVFLSYFFDEDMNMNIKYWSSQKRTDGMGDAHTPLSKIDYIKVVRLTNPLNVFLFDYTVDLTDEVILASIY